MSTRGFFQRLASDVDLVISKTATATQGLRDHAAVAKQTKVDRDNLQASVDKLTGAQKLAQDGMTKLFSEADRLGKLYPVVEQFNQGLATANQVAQVLGGTILKVLPSDSDVQERIRNLIQAAKDGINDLQNLTDLLSQQTDRFAQAFILQLKLFEEGKITLEQLLELGQQYAATLPEGAASGQTIEEIMEILRGKR